MKYNHCVMCGELEGIEQHHVVPVSLGGLDVDENKLSLCGICHGIHHSMRRDANHSSLVKKALQRKKANGSRVGSIPHGYKLGRNNKLIPDEKEQEMLKLARKLKAQGLSLRKISAELAFNGFYNRNNKRYSPKSVVAMRLFAAQSIKQMLVNDET